MEWGAQGGKSQPGVLHKPYEKTGSGLFVFLNCSILWDNVEFTVEDICDLKEKKSLWWYLGKNHLPRKCGLAPCRLSLSVKSNGTSHIIPALFLVWLE